MNDNRTPAHATPDGGANGHKLCPGCHLEKSVVEFGRNRRRPDGLAYYCKECFGVISRTSYRRRRQALGKTVREPRQTPAGMRWCPDCEDFAPVDSFGANAASTNGVAFYCKRHLEERRQASAVKLHGSTRNYHLHHRYGIGDDEVDAMFEAQAGLCPICRRSLGAKPHVDHDHATGEIRGLLCFTCNVGLGNVSDDPERLERAAVYLRGRLTAPSRIAPGVYDVVGTAWRHQDSAQGAG